MIDKTTHTIRVGDHTLIVASKDGGSVDIDGLIERARAAGIEVSVVEPGSTATAKVEPVRFSDLQLPSEILRRINVKPPATRDGIPQFRWTEDAKPSRKQRRRRKRKGRKA